MKSKGSPLIGLIINLHGALVAQEKGGRLFVYTVRASSLTIAHNTAAVEGKDTRCRKIKLPQNQKPTYLDAWRQVNQARKGKICFVRSLICCDLRDLH